jgi:hypothetical protein
LAGPLRFLNVSSVAENFLRLLKIGPDRVLIRKISTAVREHTIAIFSLS